MLTAKLNFKRKFSIKTQLLMSVCLSACLIKQALAVFTYTDLVDTPRRLTLQIGSSQFGTVNTVSFNVRGESLTNNTPIVGNPSDSAWTQPTSPANGILFRVTSQIPTSLANTIQTVKFTVDSPLGLSCQNGSGCGSAIIPFNTISWVAYQRDSSGLDMNDGVFAGGTTQTLFDLSTENAGLKIENTLVFHYSNDIIYPAGQYTGRVIYTASLP